VKISKPLLIIIMMLTALFSACRPVSPTVSSPQPTAPSPPPTAPATKGAGTAVAVKPGDYEETMVAGGKTRHYLLHVPPAYDGQQKMPLVIVLHGGGGNARSTAGMTGMSTKADKAGFIAVYPNGTGLISDEKLLTWNAWNCCGYALDNNVDDVGFIRELIDKLESELSVDTARIFATGISNGGMMSYRLGCELSDRIAAMAPVAGAMSITAVNPGNPVAVIIFHGTADDHVLYEGGTPRTQLDTHARVDQPVSYAVGFWVKADGCSATAAKETKGHIVKEIYRGGRNGTEVVLYTIIGGKHAWPGGKTAWLGGDVPTREISATDLMWDFFVSHPKQKS